MLLHDNKGFKLIFHDTGNNSYVIKNELLIFFMTPWRRFKQNNNNHRRGIKTN